MKRSMAFALGITLATLAAPAAFADGKGNGNGNGNGHAVGHDDDRGRPDFVAERGRGNDERPDVRGPRPKTPDGTEVVDRDEGYRNHGERVSIFVAIAKALGFEGRVGALQANFGTKEEGTTKPGNSPADWQDVNLDVNKDGKIDELDRALALAPPPPPAVQPVPVPPATPAPAPAPTPTPAPPV